MQNSRKPNWMLCVILMLLGAAAQGQSVSFLGIAPDARSAALGGAGVATTADAWSLYWNGAKTAFSEKPGEIGYSYMPRSNEFMKGSRQHAVGGYYRLGERGSVLLGFRHSSAGKFEDPDGFDSKPMDFTFEAGYAYRLTEHFSAGANVRYLRSDLDLGENDVAHGAALDLSLFYRLNPGWINDSSLLTLGLTGSNFGPKIAYDEDKYALPAAMRLGASFRVPFSDKHAVTALLEGGYRLAPSDMKEYEAVLGAEYAYDRYAVLRAGYHFGDIENGGSDFLALGGGVRFSYFSADFSWQYANRGSEARDNLMRLSVGMDLSLLFHK
ncbi:MAG: PorV/PorQ family protein [Culturomica sp.]|jgi:opacity protein-like surface antigen|nr:PorV/PorQ family protein [Culturomica sp.]